MLPSLTGHSAALTSLGAFWAVIGVVPKAESRVAAV